MGDDRRVVWVSGAGRVQYCPRCHAPKGECACRTLGPVGPAGPPRDGYLRVGRASKGRGGKTVTTITGGPESLAELRALVQTLKKVCGAGGTVRADGVIEIQGDVRDRVDLKLTELGFHVKRVGG